jgi:hypothetical protein
MGLKTQSGERRSQEMIRLDREFLQHPHDLYRRLREQAPVTPVVMWGGVPVWLVTRYAAHAFADAVNAPCPAPVRPSTFSRQSPPMSAATLSSLSDGAWSTALGLPIMVLVSMVHAH